MADLRTASADTLFHLGAEVGRLGAQAQTMEEAAAELVTFLYERVRGGDERACPLVRLFKTHRYAELDARRQLAARRASEDGEPAADLTCVCLLASRGDLPDWNDPARSEAHGVIPLPDRDAARRIPMIGRLFDQIGLEATPAPGESSVFLVEEARGSLDVPDQGFVLRHGVESVLGFGGPFPSGDLFAVVMFSRVPMSRRTADLFQSVARSARLVLQPFDRKRVFSAG